MSQETTLNDFLKKTYKRRNSNSDLKEETGKKKPNMETTIPLMNKYEPLMRLDHEEIDQGASTTTKTNSQTIASKKQKPPPPIILKAIPIKDKYIQFTENIKTHVKNGFKIKNGRKNTTLFIQTEADWNYFKNKLKEQNVEFYTFTSKTDKTHAFVLKGLQHEEDPSYIKEQLEQKNIPTRQVYRMRTKTSPMYMVITDNSITINKIKQVNVISNIIITWEKLLNKKRTIQCHRCQEWSHSRSNCNAQPRCLFCAGEHWSRDCENKNKTPKCTNCNEPHLANDENCKVYQQRIKKIQENNSSNNNTKKTPNSKPAPPDNDETNFPSFSNKPAPAMRQWNTPERKTNQGTATTTDSRPSQPKDQEVNNNEFFELLSEIKKLNNMCNIRNMINAIRDLNTELTKCPSDNEKFLTIMTFMSTKLANYGL